MILLKVSGLAKSVYYYTLSKVDKDDKNKEIIDKIKEIFINNKERYGYRRITLELRNQGYNVNHKKVYRIMVKLGLKSFLDIVGLLPRFRSTTLYPFSLYFEIHECNKPSPCKPISNDTDHTDSLLINTLSIAFCFT